MDVHCFSTAICMPFQKRKTAGWRDGTITLWALSTQNLNWAINNIVVVVVIVARRPAARARTRTRRSATHLIYSSPFLPFAFKSPVGLRAQVGLRAKEGSHLAIGASKAPVTVFERLLAVVYLHTDGFSLVVCCSLTGSADVFRLAIAVCSPPVRSPWHRPVWRSSRGIRGLVNRAPR